MKKEKTFIKCPMCGCQAAEENFTGEHTMIVSVRKQGKKGRFEWSIRYSGYLPLKKRANLLAEKVSFRHGKLNGCDKFPDCLSCAIPTGEIPGQQCPDEVAYLTNKTKARDKREMAQKMRAEGYTNQQIMKAVGAAYRSVTRYCNEGEKK
jgi:hypothetical protein